MRIEFIAVGELVSKFAAAIAILNLALSMPGILPAELDRASAGSAAFS